MRPVPVSAIASRTLSVPPILTWWLIRSSGPGLFAQAQCATTSAPASARLTAAASRMSASTKSAALDQLSGRCRAMPTTSWPWLSNRAARPRPSTPLAPVTAILTDCPLHAYSSSSINAALTRSSRSMSAMSFSVVDCAAAACAVPSASFANASNSSSTPACRRRLTGMDPTTRWISASPGAAAGALCSECRRVRGACSRPARRSSGSRRSASVKAPVR